MALTIGENVSKESDAPPTRAPFTFATLKISDAFNPFTDPP